MGIVTWAPHKQPSFKPTAYGLRNNYEISLAPGRYSAMLQAAPTGRYEIQSPLGKLKKAESWYARTDPVTKRFYSAVLADARGASFSPAVIRIWDQDASFCLFDPEIAVKLASAGDFRWAERLGGPQEAAFDNARAGLSDYSSLSRGSIVRHIIAHPEKQHQQAGVEAAGSLQEAFPCHGQKVKEN